MNFLISPSLLAADFLHLYDDVKRAEEAGADMLHCDVMDGLYVPNISFGFSIIEKVKSITTLPLDVHMMTCTPERYINTLKNSGADIITVHSDYSEPSFVKDTIYAIKDAGIKAGISLKPKCTADSINDIIPISDLILVMTVEPGFGGQKFMADMMPKVQQLRKTIDIINPDCILSVDGGINNDTIKIASRNGANCYAAGTCFFKSESAKETCKLLRTVASDNYKADCQI